MNDRFDQDLVRRISEFALPGALTLVMAFITYYSISSQLESSRPPAVSEHALPTPESPAPIVSGHARLWEDPFLAMARVHEEIHGDEPHEQHPDRRQLSNYFRKYLPSDKEKQLLVMPVLVTGGVYADDQETRRRIRYAVLRGLAAEGYSLRYPDRISMVHVNTWVVAGKDELKPEQIDVPLKLYQLSAKEDAGNRPQRVMVLWINEKLLGNSPLLTLAHILHRMFGEIDEDYRNRIRLRIVGPSGSDMLLRIAESHRNWGKKVNELLGGNDDDRHVDELAEDLLRLLFGMIGADPKALNLSQDAREYRDWLANTAQAQYFAGFAEGGAVLFSPRATISMSTITDAGMQDAMRQLRFNVTCDGDSGLTFRRAIGEDELLVKLLAQELKLRSAWPVAGDDSQKILLITEQDTSYGRAIPDLFLHELGGGESLRVEKYLRGLDGRLPQETGPSRGNGAKQEQGASGDTVVPFGRNQLDYLRRLASGLKHNQNEDTLAVGVVGTDIYDKLLIIRALRREFPGALFFSTDLDARMFASQETPFTRNLIVASHYALQLKTGNGESSSSMEQELSFRDSYQTATFLATRWAVSGGQVELPPYSDQREAPALLFEIGRNSARQLTRTDAGRPVAIFAGGVELHHPPSDAQREPLTGFWPLVGVLGGVVLLSVTWTRSWRQPWLMRDLRSVAHGQIARGVASRLAMFLLLTFFWVFVLVQIWLVHHGAEGEPFSLYDGVSVWPSVLLDTLAITLAVVFLARNQRELDGSVTEVCRLVLGRGFQRRPLPAYWLAAWRVRWGWLSWVGGDAEPQNLVRHYARRATRQARILRNLPRFLLVLATFGSLFLLLDPLESNNSCRGILCRVTDLAVSVGAVSLLLVLVLAVVDALETCRRFIRGLQQQPIAFADAARGPIRRRYDVGDDAAEALLTVRMIASHTDVLLKSVRAPFWMMLLIILAHYPLLFENPSPSPTLSIILGACVIALIGCVWGLRLFSHKAREAVLDRLRATRARATTDERRDQCDEAIDIIEREHEGAYRAWSQDPVLAGLLIPSGGVSAAFLVQYFLPTT